MQPTLLEVTIHMQSQIASPVDMINEGKFSTIRLGFFQRRKLSRRRAVLQTAILEKTPPAGKVRVES